MSMLNGQPANPPGPIETQILAKYRAHNAENPSKPGAPTALERYEISKEQDAASNAKMQEHNAARAMKKAQEARAAQAEHDRQALAARQWAAKEAKADEDKQLIERHKAAMSRPPGTL